jgi:hypothetical protein
MLAHHKQHFPVRSTVERSLYTAGATIGSVILLLAVVATILIGLD